MTTCIIMLLSLVASSCAFMATTGSAPTKRPTPDQQRVVRSKTNVGLDDCRLHFADVSMAMRTASSRCSRLFAVADDIESDSDDEDDDDDDIPSIFSSPDPFTSFPYGDPTNADQEAADLKAAMTEVINEAVAAGIDDIASLRAAMQRELQLERQVRLQESEERAQATNQALLNKIDCLTSEFMQKTETSRLTTKLAATADRNMQGKAIQGGVWGTVGGAGVLIDGYDSDVLLGSVQAAVAKKQKNGSSDDATSSSTANSNSNAQSRILVVADTTSDDYAKKILPLLKDLLQDALPNLQVEMFTPTTALPIGGNDAQCVIWFATSLSDSSSISKALDRVMQRTLRPGGGSVSQPPSQFVMVSTIGTQRTNQMPFSMQNMFGGKLEKRRGMEETLVAWIKKYGQPAADASDASSSSVGLDYTICKLGELKHSTGAPLQIAEGDALETSVDPATAAKVLLQAIAFQPSARNTTFSVAGSLPLGDVADGDDSIQEALDDGFLRLDGPELLRIDLPGISPQQCYEQLAEYIREWAELLAMSGKGMTTPIRYQVSAASLPRGVVQQQACQLVFVATATGKNYLSKEEEREREAKGIKKDASNLPAARLTKEGGVEFVIEVTKGDMLRVRAKRCSYARDAAIKELSESTILNRFKDSMAVWKREHQQSATN